MKQERVTGQAKRGVAVALLVVSLSVTIDCDGTRARDAVPAENPPAVGGTVAGLIVRDDETRSDIDATAQTPLPKHDTATGPLSLVVTKSRYRLDLLLRDTRIKTYPVALGGAPSGAKQIQGDSRTPEGEYLLFPHHPSPSFGGSFYVAYPNEKDALRGFEAGRIDAEQRDRVVSATRGHQKPPYQTPLGGLILLHGTKQRWVPVLTSTNWTDGCIAMENDDLEKLLEAFDSDDRPRLRILP